MGVLIMPLSYKLAIYFYYFSQDFKVTYLGTQSCGDNRTLISSYVTFLPVKINTLSPFCMFLTNSTV